MAGRRMSALSDPDAPGSSSQSDHAVVVALAPVDHGRLLVLLVDEQVEVVTDELHLVERLAEGHRCCMVGLLADDRGSVAHHRQGSGLALEALVVDTVLDLTEVT